jgi:hypothetical protein
MPSDSEYKPIFYSPSENNLEKLRTQSLGKVPDWRNASDWKSAYAGAIMDSKALLKDNLNYDPGDFLISNYSSEHANAFLADLDYDSQPELYISLGLGKESYPPECYGGTVQISWNGDRAIVNAFHIKNSENTILEGNKNLPIVVPKMEFVYPSLYRNKITGEYSYFGWNGYAKDPNIEDYLDVNDEGLKGYFSIVVQESHLGSDGLSLFNDVIIACDPFQHLGMTVSSKNLEINGSIYDRTDPGDRQAFLGEYIKFASQWELIKEIEMDSFTMFTIGGRNYNVDEYYGIDETQVWELINSWVDN